MVASMVRAGQAGPTIKPLTTTTDQRPKITTEANSQQQQVEGFSNSSIQEQERERGALTVYDLIGVKRRARSGSTIDDRGGNEIGQSIRSVPSSDSEGLLATPPE